MKCFVDLAPPPDVLVGCRGDRDCPDYTACENRKCINPCAERDPCARNANCRVIAHQPVCTCPDGYIGDPQTSCSLRKYQNTHHQKMMTELDWGNIWSGIFFIWEHYNLIKERLHGAIKTL